MEKDKKTSITINDKEYDVEQFDEKQMMMYNHIQDLDRKLHSAMFNVDQLKVGQDAFVKMLVDSLESESE